MKGNMSSITDHACAIGSYADDLDHVVRTLRAVNMDRLAEQVQFAKDAILAAVSDITYLVSADLDKQIKHNGDMLGSLLDIAVKCGVTPKKENVS